MRQPDMADVGDSKQTGLGGGRPPPTDRERFLTFALTAADMLLEVSPEGRIEFAAGAFQSRLGEPPEAWLGRPAERVVGLPDRAVFDGAFSTLLARDRLPPTSFRLSDPTGTPISIAGLRLPTSGGGQPRFCLTVSSLPKHALRPSPVLAGGDAVRDTVLRRADGTGDVLSLIEVAGPDGRAPQPGPLAALVDEALSAALRADGVAGELAAGRYGVVSRCGSEAELAGLGTQIGEAVRGAGVEATVETRTVALRADGLTPVQRTRALRYALDTFSRGGQQGLAKAGFAEDGLPGFVSRAYSRAGTLRRSIVERRFGLAFQPIVSMGDRAVEHYEALLRPDAALGSEFGPPGDFVALAEMMGLSEELDWAVVEAASAAARRNRGGARIAANLSGLSLQSPAFRARLLDHLDREPMLSTRLMAEITETAEIEDEAEAARTVQALRERGVTLCIDDFGAGAAAFRYLRAFRVDVVKIDGAYLRNAMRSEQDRGILASMVGLIRTVGARSVCERIETEAEARLMGSLGADMGQGWLFGRPGALP
jgi:EAL domain-containing protein (putative c-di-GMP-specific phosphodiesterase class I)